MDECVVIKGIVCFRDLEQKKTKFIKSDADIAFIKLCEKEQLIPTFVKVNVSMDVLLKRTNNFALNISFLNISIYSS